MKYTNPIIKGFHPDPSICRVGNDYYLVTSSFEYMPGIPLFHSKDLINWEKINHCITKNSQINLKDVHSSGGIFAPTIRYHKGVFYVVCTNVNEGNYKTGNFIIHTEDPFGEWSDPVFVATDGIDPSLFWEEDRVLMQVSVFENNISQIKQLEIDIETGEVLSPPQVITLGTGGRDVEAPHMYAIDGMYYLLLAEGGTREGHMVTVMRSESKWGPFEAYDNNPIVSNRDFPHEALQSVGHADLFQDSDGDWWVVALATRPVALKHNLGRETILLPIEWTDAGWPHVKDRRAKSDIYLDKNKNYNRSEEVDVFIDDFSGEKLNKEFNNLRANLTEEIEINKNRLCLTGNKYSLNDRKSPAFIGLRQKEYDFEFETKMSFKTNKENEEAGIALRMDEEHHIDFVISYRDHKPVVIIRKRVADICDEKILRLDDCESFVLKIKGDEKFYSFTISERFIDKTYIKHLSTESAWSMFTGVYVGLYASGNGYSSNQEACYDYVKMTSFN